MAHGRVGVHFHAHRVGHAGRALERTVHQEHAAIRRHGAEFSQLDEERHVAPGLLLPLGPPSIQRRQHMDENDHPKGALLFMLVYLALLAFMWTNLYLKLWTR